MFFVIIFITLSYLVFLATITMFTKIVIIVLLLSIILLAGTFYIESKQNKQDIEDFMLLYGLKKQNEKEEEQRKVQ